MYLIETHLHTKYGSGCGKLDEKTLIRGYKEAGYQGIVVTDHYNRDTFSMLGVDLNGPGDKLGCFLEGYRRMREEGQRQGIRVYRGAEIRFDESMNDYLLFGWPDDLLAEPGAIFPMGVAAFAPVCRAAGALLIQAHPYRRHCTPAIACYLDGVEVCNGNPRHNNRNRLAAEYAREYGLIATAGSDCHQLEDIGRTGIRTRVLPEDSFDLAALLRQGAFTRIGLR